MKSKIDLKVNGKKYQVEAYSMERLLDVLRTDCGLTGSKEGCGEGECGACSVFMNGELVNSCLVPALQADKAEITTIEGLEKERSLHVVQQSFLECGGAQCGICTPGMIMAGVAHLRRPDRAPAGIKEALEGNLCRCTGYTKIIEAMQRALDAQ